MSFSRDIDFSAPSPSPDPNPNRFTLSDYTYRREDEDEGAGASSGAGGVGGRIATPEVAHVVTPRSTTIRQASHGSTTSSSQVRPLPRIPTATATSPTSPIAGPSYVASPIDARSPSSPASSSNYYTPPHTGRSLIDRDRDRKGKQPETVTGAVTRPGRNGSGGSSHHRLQLHEPGPSLTTPTRPSATTATSSSASPSPSPSPPDPSTSRVSTEIEPLPSVHHSIYTQRTDHEVDIDLHDQEKGHDDKDIYAAPTLNRHHSDTKQHQGFWRRITPSTWVCRWLLLAVILESLIDLAILANILWRFNRTVTSEQSSWLIWQNKRRLPVYLIIFGLAHLWQLVLTVIAIKYKNTMQVVAVTLFNYAFLAYAVMMLYELRKILGDLNSSLQQINPDAPPDQIFTIPLNVLTAVLIGVIAVGCVSLSVIAYRVRRVFGWQKYRFLGADLQIRKLYQRFQVFECICYFTAFFCAGFGIQFIWLVLQPTDVEYIITWVMFPLLLLLLVFGRFAARYEKRWMMFVFLIGVMAGLAYFTFKLVRIWQESQTVYANISLSLTVFDALSILSLGACGVWAVWVGSGFDQGLKQAVLRTKTGVAGGPIHSAMRMWRTKSAETDVELSEKEREAQMIAQRRISID